MNILFLMGVYPNYGGVEKVSTILANEFVRRGHRVSIVSFEQPQPQLAYQELDSSIVLHRLRKPVLSGSNSKNLSRVIREEQTDILINQWAVPWYVTRLCRQAVKGTNCKIIAVHHNQPDTNARIKDIEAAISRQQGVKWINHLKLYVVRTVSRLSLRYTYNHSDRYVVLAPSFIPIAAHYIYKRTLSKALYIYNPITIDICKQINTHREKEIIWVGRIEDKQKCTQRIVEIWEELENVFPDWKMTIVGDGSNRNDLQQAIIKAGLKRISIEGFRDPTTYYDRAALLILTSEYEGAPLVVTEAMSRGVVPVVLGCYNTIYDMTDNGYGAVIVSYPYNKTTFISCLRRLMENEKLLERMSAEAYEVSGDFQRETIVAQWLQLFNQLSSRH